MGGFVGCVENLVVVGWNVGMQMIRYTAHQICRLPYFGIKKEPLTSVHTILLIYLMVDLRTIIALACMTYIANLDAYKYHWGDKKSFQQLY